MRSCLVWHIFLGYSAIFKCMVYIPLSSENLETVKDIAEQLLGPCLLVLLPLLAEIMADPLIHAMAVDEVEERLLLLPHFLPHLLPMRVIIELFLGFLAFLEVDLSHDIMMELPEELYLVFYL